MTEFVGSALYATWIYSGGTVVLTGDQRTFTFTPSIDFIDATAGADAARVRLAYLKDYAIAFSGLANDAGTATITALVEGTSGTLTIGEAGTVTGKPKITLGAFSQGVTRNAPYNDVAMWDYSFIGSGTVTYGAW